MDVFVEIIFEIEIGGEGGLAAASACVKATEAIALVTLIPKIDDYNFLLKKRA